MVRMQLVSFSLPRTQARKPNQRCWVSRWLKHACLFTLMSIYFKIIIPTLYCYHFLAAYVKPLTPMLFIRRTHVYSEESVCQHISDWTTTKEQILLLVEVAHGCQAVTSAILNSSPHSICWSVVQQFAQGMNAYAESLNQFCSGNASSHLFTCAFSCQIFTVMLWVYDNRWQWKYIF